MLEVDEFGLYPQTSCERTLVETVSSRWACFASLTDRSIRDIRSPSGIPGIFLSFLRFVGLESLLGIHSINI